MGKGGMGWGREMDVDDCDGAEVVIIFICIFIFMRIFTIT